ncbi:MAG: PAS domain-containing protein [Proteobacteria bacterium]|nr:PAS domain-containing protein [Pseudomonadota bacterium]
MTTTRRYGGSTDGEGHHSSGGRNIIAGGLGHGGRDIFFAAVQMSRMPMCLTDPHQPDNPIIFANPAFEQLTGYAQEEILGRNCRFLQGVGTDREVVAAIRRGLDAGEDVHHELLNYRKDGTPFWSALFISPVVDSDGSLVYHFASQLNVTRRREAEAVLQQSQRMETLGTMASGMAHEFNNLMTVVLAGLERAADANDPALRQKQIDRATWGAQRAARLTSQMLSFARRQFHDDKVLDIGELLLNFDNILDQMAGDAVRVSLDLPAQPILAAVDAGQMELALLNLVRNAADAMPDGGEIIVRARAKGLDGPGSADVVEVSVTDTGTGMEAHVLRRAVEPFFTTKERGKGTGLGLSMVNGFVEQTGGRLEIESGSGQGTTIRLTFPRLHPKV